MIVVVSNVPSACRFLTSVTLPTASYWLYLHEPGFGMLFLGQAVGHGAVGPGPDRARANRAARVARSTARPRRPRHHVRQAVFILRHLVLLRRLPTQAVHRRAPTGRRSRIRLEPRRVGHRRAAACVGVTGRAVVGVAGAGGPGLDLRNPIERIVGEPRTAVRRGIAWYAAEQNASRPRRPAGSPLAPGWCRCHPSR